MEPLLTALALLAWVSAYLTLVARLTRYRKRSTGRSAASVQNQYRADKDGVLWVMVLALGAGLFFLVLLATRGIGGST